MEFLDLWIALLNRLLYLFVRSHAHRHRQRSLSWYAEKKTGRMLGGSELAAAMGWNRYMSAWDLTAVKSGVQAYGGGGSVACWWGTMFEPVSERLIELDCGTTLVGTDISVPAGPDIEEGVLWQKHANSPDGYCVVVVYVDDAGTPRLRRTSPESLAAAAGRPAYPLAALVEIKSPYRRRPKSEVPRHYLPQVWSGLAVSPVADFGLFVDVAFRKCSIHQLGPGPHYDRGYHRERTCPAWAAGGAVAWGFFAVYSRRIDAPSYLAEERRVDPGAGAPPPDFVHLAWAMHCWAFGAPYETKAEAAGRGRAAPEPPEPVDFGDCPAAVFEQALEGIERGAFPTALCGPCFPDGRGAPLRTAAEIGAALDAAAARAPGDEWYLLGILPWKVLEISYIPVDRRPGFLAEIAPAVAQVLDTAARVRAAADPAAAFRAEVARARGDGEDPEKDAASLGAAESQVLDELFCAVAGV